MFPNVSGIVIQGGTLINSTTTNRTSRGMDLLMEWVATGAFHNSKELYDAPKCHPRTRVAVLDDIMKWIGESDSARDDFMLWLFGPAGSGKSAIAKRIAEIAAEMDMLIATFFFSRTSPSRGTEDRLIATLAYQLALSIPDTRTYVEDAIERDPAIFKKNVQTQIDTLLIKPFQSISPTQIFPQKLIIIDGLDECGGSQSQVAILEAISYSFTQHKLPIVFLVASRPEPDLDTSFNCNEPLRSIHRRIALDNTYRPNDDIRLFFSDKFEHIKRTHRLRSTIPGTWPAREILDTLVEKSSGQFIYASTVVKFVSSSCHRPHARLNIILGILPPGNMNPFAELDALYSHVLSSVDDIQMTLQVLSLYVMTPYPVSRLRSYMSHELFLSLEPGDIQLSLMNLSSILSYNESFGRVEILHASFVDFLSDRRRSTIYYIDKASTCTDFVRRILQCVKGPDGIQIGNVDLFLEIILASSWVAKGQLRSDILNFDLEAFINASIKWRKENPSSMLTTADTFWIWAQCLDDAVLEDEDKKEALDRLYKSLEPRLKIYQPDWRLQLLLTLTVAGLGYYVRPEIPYCRIIDILLEMDDHYLHLVDQYALDLRHAYRGPLLSHIDMIGSCLDGDTSASAALHCMRFISNPPTYSGQNKHPEKGLIYAEWKATCDITLQMLYRLLQRANTLPELVRFISDHDIHPAVQKDFSTDRVLQVNVHILAFLSRAGVCPNWRIISAIQQSLILTHQPQRSFESEESNASSDEDEE